MKMAEGWNPWDVESYQVANTGGKMERRKSCYYELVNVSRVETMLLDVSRYN